MLTRNINPLEKFKSYSSSGAGNIINAKTCSERYGNDLHLISGKCVNKNVYRKFYFYTSTQSQIHPHTLLSPLSQTSSALFLTPEICCIYYISREQFIYSCMERMSCAINLSAGQYMLKLQSSPETSPSTSAVIYSAAC